MDTRRLTALAALPLLAFVLCQPAQAGVAGAEPPPKPTAAEIRATLEEQMMQVAQHNAQGAFMYVKDEDIARLIGKEQDEDGYEDALDAFLDLQEELDEEDARRQFADALTIITSAYACQPARRPQLGRFLREAAQQGKCRELCLIAILRAGVLSPANKELAEDIAASTPFDPAALERCMDGIIRSRPEPEEAQEGLSTETLKIDWEGILMWVGIIPAAVEEHRAELLIRSCLDLDSPAIAARLMEQGAFTRDELAAERKEYCKAMHFTPRTRAEAFACFSVQMRMNHYHLVWPWPSFVQPARLEKGLSRAWGVAE